MSYLEFSFFIEVFLVSSKHIPNIMKKKLIFYSYLLATRIFVNFIQPDDDNKCYH